MRKFILPIFLIVSLLTNVFLFQQVLIWQKSWLEQALTTYDIESLFRKSGADTSFEAIQMVTKLEYSDSYKVVPVLTTESSGVALDQNAIIINNTKLYFKDNVYAGSAATLLNNGALWLPNDDF
jgi:hypothetical protein